MSNSTHPISGIAESIDRITGRFEPGTRPYEEVVVQARAGVDKARDRDDLVRVVDALEAKVLPHLTDDELGPFKAALEQLRKYDGPWPVEAFKEAFNIGTGKELPDDGHAAGRGVDPRGAQP